MNIIKQNPFRILGVPANATERELQKQIAIIKRYAEVGKRKSFDYDFKKLGNLTRDIDNIQEAANRIGQARNKLLYSLFWFVNNSPIDEIAINYLKQDIRKSIEIWKKSLKNEITNKNFCSYQNLSTLALIYSIKDNQVNLKTLRIAIKLKGNLIHSDNLKDFSKLVTGNGIANDPIKISKKFVDEIIEFLKPFLNKTNGITTKDLISLFSTYPEGIQKYVSSMFTEVSISNIENNIDKTTRKRIGNPKEAEIFGEDLYNSTKSDLIFLKTILGTSDVQCQIITNKLADEILQCSIDFFNKTKKEDTELDPGIYALRIAELARSVEAHGQVLDRINETIEAIQDWIDDTPNREKLKAVRNEVDFITTRILQFENEQDSVDNVEEFLNTCKPILLKIKNRIGKYDDFYISISSAVVRNAQNMLVSTVNSAIEDTSKSINILITGSSSLLKAIITKALKLTYLLGYFDMDTILKEHYNNNLKGIKSIAQNLHISTMSPEDKVRSEILNLEGLLSHTKRKQYYASELQNLNNEMMRIRQWQAFRTAERKETEIKNQQQKINNLKLKGGKEKAQDISRIEEQLRAKKRELNQIIN